MDRETLKAKAQSRREVNEDSESYVRLAPTWDCEYCKRSFKLEKAFMRHHCEERSRIEFMRSVEGQNAYAYYSDWMRASGRSVPPIATFIHSSFYTTFVKFALHVQRVSMPAPQAFIKMMVAQKVQPSLWCRDNVYAMYMQQYEKGNTPEMQYIDSVDFAYEYSLKHEIDITKIFSHMGIEKFLNYVQKRKLSPWFLATSSVFRTWLKTLEGFDAQRVEESVKVGALMIRIKSNPEMTKLFGDFCKATKEFNL